MTARSASMRPGVLLGRYPERSEPEPSRVERVISSLGGLARQWVASSSRGLLKPVQSINRQADELKNLSESDLALHAQEIRRMLFNQGFDEQLVVDAFALVREVSGRRVGMRHYDVQLMGGWAMLFGNIAEMQTGEGKTLTANLPAATAALAGVPVHVVTVNDYLVERDAEFMRPVYEFLSLTVGVIRDGMEHEERQQAYSCDITYCTNKQIAFDYLRDRLVLAEKPGKLRFEMEALSSDQPAAEKLLMRGLCYAIVDEADSVFIDEARTPLILSRATDASQQAVLYQQAMSLAHSLEESRDYFLNQDRREAQLTLPGQQAVWRAGEQLGGVWRSRRRAEELVVQALKAINYFLRDVHYLVRDDKIVIIDEYTGRTMPDRSWEQGLHQLIEVKEGCEVTAPPETLARISYQRFFRRYLHLSGMTGTAREIRGELWSSYKISVIPIPTRKPSRRLDMPSRLFATTDEKWDYVTRRTGELVDVGRAVLVGTRSVEASEELSRFLTEAAISHRVLSAAQDSAEADIVAQAGAPGHVTVATNMAGRGTDIELHEDVETAGGLHVIATERHSAGRIDRQLLGRCARQGDPGSTECVTSLEDEIAQAYYSPWFLSILRSRLSTGRSYTGGVADIISRRPQRKAEVEHASARKSLLQLDEQLGKMLSFSGTGE